MFAIVCRDKPGALELRLATREAHLAYVRESREKIEMAGPLMNEAGEMAGSILFLNVETKAEAEAWAAADPYALAGLFQSVNIDAWTKTVG